MSRLGAKLSRRVCAGTVHGPCSIRSTPPLPKPRPNRYVPWAEQVERAWREYRAPLFSPGLLAAATVAAWLVIAAIVVACVAAVAGDAPARVRRPVGFDTISEGA